MGSSRTFTGSSTFRGLHGFGVLVYPDQWVDSRHKLSPEKILVWDFEDWCFRKIQDLNRQYRQVAYALEIPRRLGGAASSKELGLDKRRIRKIMFSCLSLDDKWRSLCKLASFEISTLTSEEKKYGAQLVVEEFLHESIEAATLQRSIFSTRVIQSGRRSLANKGCRYYSQEIDNCERILSLGS